MGAIYKRGRVYWLKFYDHGRPIYESAKTRNHEEASRLLKLREGAIGRGEPGERPAARITVAEAFADVVNEYRAHGRRSIKHLERRIAKYLGPYFGDRPLAAVTTADVRAYITKRQAAGASNGEVNRETGILGRAFVLAHQAGRIAIRPHVPRLAESAPRSGFFEREQFKAIRRHLPEYVQPAVAFMYETGWRKREVLDLTWKNVDFRGRRGAARSRDHEDGRGSRVPVHHNASTASHRAARAGAAVRARAWRGRPLRVPPRRPAHLDLLAFLGDSAAQGRARRSGASRL